MNVPETPISDLAHVWHIIMACLEDYIDGLVQERRNSGALAMELHLSFINPPI